MIKTLVMKLMEIPLFVNLPMLLCVSTFSQPKNPERLLVEEQLLLKSRQQKAVGWIFTGAGAVGLVMTMNADVGQSLRGGLTTLFTLGMVEPEYKSYTVPYLLSAAALGTGIGFFIASSKSKKKAREIALSAFFKVERAPMIQPAGLAFSSFPSIALKGCF
jgi:hypothetical protein